MAGGEMNPRPEPRSEAGNHQAASPPVSDAATGERRPPAALISAPRSFAGTIKQLFREVKQALTGEAPAPQPTQRRRRTEDTGRAFRMAAGKMLRRTFRLPAAAYAAATASVWDTLDWLNQWHGGAASPGQFDEDFCLAPTPTDYLYPHL